VEKREDEEIMKLSNKKRQELYSAMADEIGTDRIKVRRSDENYLHRDEFDEMMFKLEKRIWDAQKKVLGIKD